MTNTRPASASSFRASLVAHGLGLIAFVALSFAGMPALVTAAVVFLVTCGAMVITEFGRFGSGIRPEGIGSARPKNWHRTRIKLVGLFATLLPITAIYIVAGPWMEANAGSFYALSPFILLGMAVAAPFVFVETDRRMSAPRDSYWYLGRFVLSGRLPAKLGIFRTHALGWAIKAFFLPLMITWFLQWTANFSHAITSDLTNPQNLFKCGFAFIIFFDLLGAVIGYSMTFKVIGTQIRSVQCLFTGWLAALVCYPPLNQLTQVLAENINEYSWVDVLAGHPIALVVVACTILGLELVYTLATVAFGPRFSNLTNRGIITGGPYRWTKHPAYLAKNSFWWMMTLPFLFVANDPLWMVTCVSAVSMLYFVRAKSEEVHLRADPAYREYAAWIEEHGVFAPLTRMRRRLLAPARPTVAEPG